MRSIWSTASDRLDWQGRISLPGVTNHVGFHGDVVLLAATVASVIEFTTIATRSKSSWLRAIVWRFQGTHDVNEACSTFELPISCLILEGRDYRETSFVLRARIATGNR
jgi:hypothetical protein